MTDFGSVPQWVTALVAVGALGAAVWSVRSQREVARKRAAIDFFTKTEMDGETLTAYEKYTKAVGAMENHLKSSRTLEEFVGTPEYFDIRGYLNLHELMGVGINQEVFDDDVCYDFWAGELTRAFNATKQLIEHIQNQPEERYTYCELQEVHKRWQERDK